MHEPTAGKHRWPRLLSRVTVALSTLACSAYEPKPLDVRQILDEVAQARRAPSTDGSSSGVEPTVSLADATAWLAARGPAVLDAIAAFRTAQARAAVSTPWPDPSLEFGPQFAFGDGVDSSRALTPFVALSISVPLGGRLGALDDVHRAEAEALRIGAELTLRDEYLALRDDLATLATARARERLADDLAETATRTANAARRLVDAGAATALDVAMFELERARVLAVQMDALTASASARGAVAARTGVAAERFVSVGPDALPQVPDTVPPPADLEALLTTHRPELVTLRAEYEIAERRLRLEVEKQYPDLVLGPEYSAEPGESRSIVRLGIGLRLPIFDRNQPAIAAAEQHREEVRTRYATAAGRALADVERRSEIVKLAARRRRALTEDVLPRAAANLELARASAIAGSIDALRLLDAERSLRALQLERIDAEVTEIAAWIALERAVGHPLVAFPGEPDGPPSLGDEFESETDSTAAPTQQNTEVAR